VIVALAGRRVDAEDAQSLRFSPAPESIALVRDRIHDKLLALQATALVSSAACGADLLALEEAGKLGLRRRIVLPFDPDKFRSTSVADRPGDWGSLYDSVLRQVQSNNDLIITPSTSGHAAYLETNHCIVDAALALAGLLQTTAVAVQVWEGASRGPTDLTEEFGTFAKSKGLAVSTVLTV